MTTTIYTDKIKAKNEEIAKVAKSTKTHTVAIYWIDMFKNIDHTVAYFEDFYEARAFLFHRFQEIADNTYPCIAYLDGRWEKRQYETDFTEVR